MFLKNLRLNEDNELYNRNLHISGLVNEDKVDFEEKKVNCVEEKVYFETKKVYIQDAKVDIEPVSGHGKGRYKFKNYIM